MKNKIAVVAALCAMAALLTASGQVIESCRGALKLCSELILPSLFPFFVLSGLLSRLGFPMYLGKFLAPAASRLFRVSGMGVSALFIGLCGGYPMGAAYIADMHQNKLISSREAEKLLAFCNNSGPAFIVGAAGVGVFASAGIGLMLYGVHICAALITGLMMRGSEPPSSAASVSIEPQSLSQALPEAVRQAVISVLNVCGFVVCFMVFTGLLDANGFFSLLSGWLSSRLGTELHWTRALLAGFFELGSGVGALSGLAATPLNLALAAGILSWGGISVHFQTLSLIADTDIKSAPHFAGRAISAAVAAGLAFLIGNIM